MRPAGCRRPDTASQMRSAAGCPASARARPAQRHGVLTSAPCARSAQVFPRQTYGAKVNTPVGLNPAQAATMLKLQDHLNSMINPAWVTSGSRFLRAAFVESAEALEHHGWKWWKKQTIDLPQVQMELVDILHFYLSHTIVQAGGSIEGAAAELMRDLAGPGTVTLDGAMRELATLDVPELLELIGGLAVRPRQLQGPGTHHDRLRDGLERRLHPVRVQERAEPLPPAARLQGRHLHQDLEWRGRQRGAGPPDVRAGPGAGRFRRPATGPVGAGLRQAVFLARSGGSR